MITDQIIFGSRKIEFQLAFSERKSLGITVKPDLKVLVRAPNGTDIQKIKVKLQKRAPWIIKQQSYFLTYHPITPEKKYVGGETHLYLGRQYRLRVIPNEENIVKLKGQFLEAYTSDKSKVKELLKKWYMHQAAKKFDQISTPLINNFKKYYVEPSALILKDMPTRWGSCTPNGKILLNPELIKAPKGCIEYVIIHELCHLVHLNHNQKFIDLQSKEMPDWKKWKNRLEQLMA